MPTPADRDLTRFAILEEGLVPKSATVVLSVSRALLVKRLSEVNVDPTATDRSGLGASAEGPSVTGMNPRPRETL